MFSTSWSSRAGIGVPTSVTLAPAALLPGSWSQKKPALHYTYEQAERHDDVHGQERALHAG